MPTAGIEHSDALETAQAPGGQPAKPPSLARNIALNIGGRGFLTLFALATTPILVHGLGPEEYGIYAVLISFGGLLGVLDFGLTPAVVTLVSHAWHHGDHQRTQRLISTALAMFLVIGLFGAGVLSPFVPWMVSDLFNVPPALQLHTALAMYLCLIALALNMWLSVFNVVPIALERYDLVTGRTVVLSFSTTIATIVAVLLGGDVLTLIGINFVAAVIGLALFFYLSRRLLPTIQFRPAFDRESFRQLARFGGFKFAGTVGGILTLQFDRIALGAIVGLQAVTYYSVPANVMSKLYTIFNEIVSPFFPRASKLRDDPAELRRMLARGSRLMALVAAPIMVTLFVFADFVLLYWFGGNGPGTQVSRESTEPMRWLIGAYFMQVLAAVPVIICEAMGKPEVNNGFSVASAVVNVPLVLVLGSRFGIVGAAVALFATSTAQTVLFTVYVCRKLLKIGVGEWFMDALAKPFAAASVAGLLGFLLRPAVSNFIMLVVVVLVVVAVYCVACLLLSAVTRQELAILGGLLERAPAWVPGREGMYRWLTGAELQGP